MAPDGHWFFLADVVGETADAQGWTNTVVYLLCAATSFGCFVMLLRGYFKSGFRLLLWSSLCFAGLTLDNVMLYIDLAIVPDFDLTGYRRLPGLIGLILLIYGLVWESK
jgi:hypothetical protein